MKRAVAALCAASALAGCASPRGPSPAASQSSPQREEVTRVLDFSADVAPVDVAVRLPYGRGGRRVGYVPRCTGDACDPPCPCSTQLQPASFDVGVGEEVWVLDYAKGRIARFDGAGRFAGGLPLGRLAYRSWDLQLEDDRPFVLAQDFGYDARVLFAEPDGRVSRRVFFEGGPVELGGSISASGGAGYVHGYAGELGDEEVFLEVPLDPAAPRLEATEAPGRPMLDGWLLYVPYRGPRLIPLEFDGGGASWATDVRLLTKRAAEEEPRDRGIVSWEVDVGPDGTIHLLVHAGLRRFDGYWYLRVSGDGEVGEPVRLRGPGIADDQQTRRLTLDAEGKPYVMWAGRRALVISPLDGL